MLAIAVYIGLFAWGMQAEKLNWKHFAVIFAIAAAMALLGFWTLGGFDGANPVYALPLVFLAELVIDGLAFFAGYGIGRFRRRGQAAQDDVGDTFS